jgi:hypothetical protein
MAAGVIGALLKNPPAIPPFSPSAFPSPISANAKAGASEPAETTHSSESLNTRLSIQKS